MKRPTIQEYLRFRLGLKSATVKELFMKFFSKPFQAVTLREFWYFWNPFYTYFLTYFIYKPFKKLLPKSLSMLITFVLCGYLLHDVVNMLISASINGLFIPFPRSGILFLFFGLSMVVSDALGLTFKTVPQKFRPLIHISILVLLFIISFFCNNWLESIIN